MPNLAMSAVEGLGVDAIELADCFREICLLAESAVQRARALLKELLPAWPPVSVGGKRASPSREMENSFSPVA